MGATGGDASEATRAIFNQGGLKYGNDEFVVPFCFSETAPRVSLRTSEDEDTMFEYTTDIWMFIPVWLNFTKNPLRIIGTV